jgi:cytochrome c-type biogenesis protein CcmE
MSEQGGEPEATQHEQHEQPEQREQREQRENDGLAVPIRKRRQAPEASKKGLLLVMALVGVGAGVVALALGGLKDNAIYSKPVDELLRDRTKYVGRPVRADGMLVHGTLKRRESPCEYKFEIEKSGQSIPVRYAQCVVPDTFQDVAGMDVQVTVEGELKADGSFEATSVLTKCPSKYEEKMKAGEKNPHLLVGTNKGS